MQMFKGCAVGSCLLCKYVVSILSCPYVFVFFYSLKIGVIINQTKQ
jgi:hypothetical protein